MLLIGLLNKQHEQLILIGSEIYGTKDIADLFFIDIKVTMGMYTL